MSPPRAERGVDVDLALDHHVRKIGRDRVLLRGAPANVDRAAGSRRGAGRHRSVDRLPDEDRGREGAVIRRELHSAPRAGAGARLGSRDGALLVDPVAEERDEAAAPRAVGVDRAGRRDDARGHRAGPAAPLRRSGRADVDLADGDVGRRLEPHATGHHPGALGAAGRDVDLAALRGDVDASVAAARVEAQRVFAGVGHTAGPHRDVRRQEARVDEAAAVSREPDRLRRPEVVGAPKATARRPADHGVVDDAGVRGARTVGRLGVHVGLVARDDDAVHGAGAEHDGSGREGESGAQPVQRVASRQSVAHRFLLEER